MEFALLTGLGLAAPAGLNAYIPLLVLALAARFSDTVTLAAPYDLLSSTVGIGIILLLLTVEIVVDKVPGLDHVNDILNSVVRPAAGALLVLSATSDGTAINPILAAILGIGAAGTVHAAKVTTRAASTTTTAGLFNPVLSFAEDVVAAISSILAIFVPIAVVVFLIGFAGFVLWAVLRRGRRRRVVPARESPNLRR